jgi:hypothetical protein
MPILTLKPDTNVRIKYSVPKSGWVSFNVEAESPVDTFILDADGVKQFNQGEAFVDSYGGFTNRRVHEQEIRLPFKGPWWLIIKNSNTKKAAAVHYEVSA